MDCIKIAFHLSECIPFQLQENGSSKKVKPGRSLVDEAYRRAKSMKAISKSHVTKKNMKNADKRKKLSSEGKQSKKEEMLELFQNDMSERKQAHTTKKSGNVLAKRKSKSSFKSKSRYVGTSHNITHIF